MADFLLAPPVAFTIILTTVLLLSWALTRFSYRRTDARGAVGEPYACGEDKFSTLVQPEYGHFFPFAFFFTILHVIALIIATVPKETVQTFVLSMIYIIGAVVGLLILFRRD